jgi:hypothetical protein
MGDMASRSRQAPEWDAIDLAKFNSVSSDFQEAPRLESPGVGCYPLTHLRGSYCDSALSLV